MKNSRIQNSSKKNFRTKNWTKKIPKPENPKKFGQRSTWKNPRTLNSILTKF